MNQSMNQSMNDEAVCRTAPATPGLLNTTPFIMGITTRPVPSRYIYFNQEN